MAKHDGTATDIAARLEALADAELQRLGQDSRATVRALVRREQARRDRQSAENARLAHMLEYEQSLWASGVEHVAGIDEVGVGPLAGPVVAAAVILPVGCSIAGVNDSKQLSAEMREHLAPVIREHAVAYAVGLCSVAEIDHVNIYHAALEAMRRAVVGLARPPQHLLVDARRVPHVDTPQTAIIGGDARSQSIAAASILAKVHRDELMRALAVEHPGYGFDEHKGYGTSQHLAALQRLGPCRAHRRSFAPTRQAELLFRQA
jgi:ribonuclease HII